MSIEEQKGGRTTSTPQPKATPITDLVECGECGTVGYASEAYCVCCGTARNNERIRCPHCHGEINHSRANYCPHCGRRFGVGREDVE